MSATGMVVAIDALLSITQLSVRMMEAANQISATLSAAQSEGRDLTDAEVDSIKQMREDAVDSWNIPPADSSQ